MDRQKWLMIFVAAALLLTACQGATSSSSMEGESVAAVSLAAAAPELAEVGLAEPTATVEAEAASAAQPDACLSCHADKELLIETAKPVAEAAEGESKGVG